MTNRRQRVASQQQVFSTPVSEYDLTPIPSTPDPMPPQREPYIPPSGVTEPPYVPPDDGVGSNGAGAGPIIIGPVVIEYSVPGVRGPYDDEPPADDGVPIGDNVTIFPAPSVPTNEDPPRVATLSVDDDEGAPLEVTIEANLPAQSGELRSRIIRPGVGEPASETASLIRRRAQVWVDAVELSASLIETLEQFEPTEDEDVITKMVLPLVKRAHSILMLDWEAIKAEAVAEHERDLAEIREGLEAAKKGYERWGGLGRAIPFLNQLMALIFNLERLLGL
jgi:hypothetical protein